MVRRGGGGDHDVEVGWFLQEGGKGDCRTAEAIGQRLSPFGAAVNEQQFHIIHGAEEFSDLLDHLARADKGSATPGSWSTEFAKAILDERND